MSTEGIQSAYNISALAAKRVYEILHNSSSDLYIPDQLEVYSDLLMQNRSTAGENYERYTYKNDVVSWESNSNFEQMFDSEEESVESMKQKKISIVTSFVLGGIASIKDHGLFSFAQLGVDLRNVSVVSDYHAWKHEVQLRANFTEKLTSILYGGEYLYGARTQKISYDFEEHFSGGVGGESQSEYTRVFQASTPSYNDPREICYLNFMNGGLAENLDAVHHGFVTFRI